VYFLISEQHLIGAFEFKLVGSETFRELCAESGENSVNFGSIELHRERTSKLRRFAFCLRLFVLTTFIRSGRAYSDVARSDTHFVFMAVVKL
jgi:hypothetical protein